MNHFIFRAIEKKSLNLLISKVKFSSSTLGEYQPIFHGAKDTKNFRIYYQKNNQMISPFHDIPLFSNKDEKILNMVVEIPRHSHAKMEINKKEYLNPISQDIKKDKLRYINNIYPYYGYIWNYGAFPQTYDDPDHVDETTGCIGDNDPLDAIELGTNKQNRGAVIQVKVLGALGLIDEGEADWKVLTIDINDKLAPELNDISDVESKLPGVLEATRDWFKHYKIPNGKPANKFAMNGRFFDRDFSLKIIEKSFNAWVNLVQEKENKKAISLVNTSLENLNTVSDQNARQKLEEIFTDADILNSKSEKNLTEVEKIYYIDRSKNY
ncbi:inorganic pyrophosphatase [Brachionus plicatilis]|uniref:inorganic diphosphatase n=1 Tax=Brachionus plicatilis TaxID=10195 RepID=A0A3M7T6E4_BRAPC|nr:inorganic pyrophosphatase [Brachionus plicatilis]